MPEEGTWRERPRATVRAAPNAQELPGIPAEELIRLCIAHEPGAWEEMIRRYANLIHAVILKVGLTPEDREDAFQSTITVLYTDLPKLRDPGRLPSWLIGIAYRQAVNRIRGKMRSRETSIDEIEERGDGRSAEPNDPRPLADEIRADLEHRQQIAEALDAISERCRELLRLLFFEEPPLDYAEIARRQGMPIGSIGPTRARCLERMRKVYEERGWSG
ncbi:MAG: RNA polymerase sigma factor [Candidatus Eisenbacteria bacterium]|nr:sigma-70 family RNA polymerase sigma factor [Candidatus Eisenbacteria bacterium]